MSQLSKTLILNNAYSGYMFEGFRGVDERVFCSSAFAELVIWYHISTQRPIQNDRHYHTAFVTLFHCLGLFLDYSNYTSKC